MTRRGLIDRIDLTRHPYILRLFIKSKKHTQYLKIIHHINSLIDGVKNERSILAVIICCFRHDCLCII